MACSEQESVWAQMWRSQNNKTDNLSENWKLMCKKGNFACEQLEISIKIESDSRVRDK